MHRGWVKVWRKLRDHEIMTDEGLCQMFLYLLLSVNSKPGRVYGVDLQPGQMVVGRDALAAALGVPTGTAYYRLRKLAKCQVLDLQSNTRHTIVTLRNWELYNGADCEVDQQLNIVRSAFDQRLITNKNEKNKRNTNNTRLAADAAPVFVLNNQPWTGPLWGKLVKACGGDTHLANRVLYRARNADDPIAWVRAGLKAPDRYAFRADHDEDERPAAVQSWIDALWGKGKPVPTSRWNEGPTAMGDVLEGLGIGAEVG